MEYTFEEGMKRLEEINTALERDTVPLDDMMKLYKEGMEITRGLTEKLDMTEKEIQRIEGGIGYGE